MSSIFIEQQFLKTRSYSEIAQSVNMTTGYDALRNRWLIRDSWDDCIAFFYPDKKRLYIIGEYQNHEPVTFMEAIDLLTKKALIN